MLVKLKEPAYYWLQTISESVEVETTKLCPVISYRNVATQHNESINSSSFICFSFFVVFL